MSSNAMTPNDIKQVQEEVQQDYIDRTRDKDVEIVMNKKRPELKIPVKVALRREVQVSDLPAVWLFAFGNLSVEEYNKYLAENKSSLTINELAASTLLEGVLKNNREDKAIYWKLQEKILAKPASVKQSNSIADLKPNAIMSKLLDEIEENVFKEAKEGQVVEQESNQRESSQSI